DDLQKFEDEQMTGPGRINSTTNTVATREEPIRKHVQKSEKDKKEIKAEKRGTNGLETPSTNKRKKVKDTGTPPPSKHNGDKELQKPGKVSRKRENGKNNKKVAAEKSNTSEDTQTVADMPIDPNEPIYCYCKQVSYGEMVACDNTECEIEWFHFACVKLTDRPKGKWYCFDCSEKVKQRHKK
ncbi:13727_t:CDS:1, partial [Acaulospora morrowiae]